MSHGPISYFTQTITAGNTLSPAYDLGRAWPYVYLIVPAMSGVGTATCNIYVQASFDNATYYQVVFPPVNSATTGLVTFTVANSASQCVVPIPNSIRYLKVQLGNTATVAAGIAFTILCAGD